MQLELLPIDIILRLLGSVIAGGLIGIDREHKNRPAGVKTDVLVCVGACVIALIQKDIGYNAIAISLEYPKIRGVIRADDARMIAQVVSGIGFLGAGTIMVHNRTIRGLTTAATIWAVGGLGLAMGMGNYFIAVASTVTVMLVLIFLDKIVHIYSFKRIEICYRHKVETKKFIQDYFEKKLIMVNNVDFQVSRDPRNDEKYYINSYEIELPRQMNYADVIEDLSLNKNILKIRTISV